MDKEGTSFIGSDRRRVLIGYALAVFLCLLASVAYLAFPILNVQVPFLAYYPAVAIPGWFGGFGPGAVGTVASVLASLRAGQAADVLDLSQFVLVAMMVSLLAELHRRDGRRDRQLRLNAEDRARQVEHLHELTTALSRSRTPAEVTETCVLESTYSFGAAAGTMVFASADGSWGELAHAVGLSEELRQRWQRFELTSRSPLSDVLRTRTVRAIESRASCAAKYAELPPDHFILQFESTIAVPLVGRGGAIGVLWMGFDAPRDWTFEQQEFALKFAQRTVQALERARMYDLAERARKEAEEQRALGEILIVERQKVEGALRESEGRYRSLAARTIRLHALTASMSEAVTPDAVAKAVIRQGKVVVGAQAGSVALLADNGKVFISLYEEDGNGQVSDTPFRRPVEPGLLATDAVQTRQPVLVGSFADWQQRYPQSAARAADGGYASVATLPLLAEGTAIGVLEFCFTAPVNFDDTFHALLTSVAQHCAQALDRARLYEAEQHARSSAEAANLSKDEFLSTVSHELRTPLNVILGWSSMLRLGALDGEQAKRATQAIHDNASRQAQLIDELLDVSRIVAGRAAVDLHDIDLGDSVRGAVDSIMPLAEAKGVRLQLGALPALRMMADPRRLEQVFMNLLSNAVKFTPPGGKIQVDMNAASGKADIRVSDTGIGIEAAFLPYVFDRFRQADAATTRNHGGLGLGLAIAKHFVEAHRGNIRVESPGLDQGTTFVVSFPVKTQRASDLAQPRVTDQTAGRPAAAPNLDGITVLVVDDEADAREMIATALENCGAHVVMAASAREAVDTLSHADIDVLLADIGMAGEDGYELIRRVRRLPRAKDASIPAAAVTAYAREDQRRQALEAGFQLHLAKPFDALQLAQMVARLHGTEA